MKNSAEWWIDALRGEARVFYTSYLRSALWKQRRREYIEAHGERCEGCGVATERKWNALYGGQFTLNAVTLHHLSYDNVGREPDGDLELLCRSCHRKAHRGDDKGAPLFIGAGGHPEWPEDIE